MVAGEPAALVETDGRGVVGVHIQDDTPDVAARQVRQGGVEVPVTGKEFSILLMLVEQRGRILSRVQLEEGVYSWGEEIDSNALQVHIHHLRRKLGKALIRTVHAIGYSIDKPATPDTPDTPDTQACP